MKKLKILIGILIFTYILGAAYLFIYQRDFLYFPTVQTEYAYKVVQFASGTDTIDVVVLNEGNLNAMIYFGGNAEQVEKNAANFMATFPLYTVYLVHYRGYGGSTGTPTEQGIYADAQYIYDKLIKKYKNISVIGRSLGSGVATFLASTRDIHKMVLITPYDSILHIAQDKYPIFPISLMLKDQFNSSSRIKDVKSATLIILAGNDLVIPLESSNKLIKEFPPSQVKVVNIKDTGHTSILQEKQYYDQLREFIN